ncbi:MAG: radical protein [Bacteroidetes bacterium]|nr:radical protein [Bacteroidota bacterium]
MNPKILIPRKIILFRRNLLPVWRRISKRNMRIRKTIPILHLHLVDHCNLNCRGCDNFSPLAPEVFADILTFENDCARMSKLVGNRVDEIQLLGGEPLLHPQVTEFIRISRKYFPEVPVNIISNGILLPKQPDDFWETCHKHNINIIVTKYPVKIDHNKIEQLAKKHQVRLSYYGNTESIEKNMQLLPLDLDGKQDAQDSFLRCARANRCISLDNGKLYTCSLIPYVKYFNRKFNQDLRISTNDYIDIYQAKNMEEIMNFVSKPMPFCRYCNIKGIEDGISFDISKKQITEWTTK